MGDGPMRGPLFTLNCCVPRGCDQQLYGEVLPAISANRMPATYMTIQSEPEGATRLENLGRAVEKPDEPPGLRTSDHARVIE